jgi:hypothetical protein
LKGSFLEDYREESAKIDQEFMIIRSSSSLSKVAARASFGVAGGLLAV